MTLDEAIAIINNALASVQTTRQNHELIVKALTKLIEAAKTN